MPEDIVIGSPTFTQSLMPCLSCGMTISLHGDCGTCVGCCQCLVCINCNTTYSGENPNRFYCKACGGCRGKTPDDDGCCKCMNCKACSLILSSSEERCPFCLRGTPSACGCCGQTKGPHYIKRSISLTTEEPVRHSPILVSSRLCSAEIEASDYGCYSFKLDDTLRKWKASVVHDGTVFSEINTFPARQGDFIQQVSDIYAGMVEAHGSMSTNAGCHIHVDARDFNYEATAKLMVLWALVEPALFTLVPFSRRRNQYCVPCGMSYYHRILRGVKGTENSSKSTRNILRALVLEAVYGNKKISITKVKCDKGAGPRYRAVNIHSWPFRGSLEFRLPPGMCNPYDVIMWAVTLSQLMDRAKAADLTELLKDCEYLSAVAPEHYQQPAYWSKEIRETALKHLLMTVSGEKHQEWITTTYNYYDSYYDDAGKDTYEGFCIPLTKNMMKLLITQEGENE